MGITRKELREWYKSAKCYRFVYQERKTNELWMMCAAQYDEYNGIIIINYVKDGQINVNARHRIASYIKANLSRRNIVNVDQLNCHLARVQITARCLRQPSKEVMFNIENFILNCIDNDPQNCADTP